MWKPKSVGDQRTPISTKEKGQRPASSWSDARHEARDRPDDTYMINACDHDRRDHDDEILRHADRSNDGVERRTPYR